ncbi:hypothetical protein AMS68_007114 [Peltaster fructicola]|uniref:ACB domain-containing protein n=1 Tax=Peltaster fructicola TaxID=286661 RepID=A0A6H0Y3K7_9PEZI|nr:hypothetical protein AMS68_007114 [Peltaster fructicola]
MADSVDRVFGHALNTVNKIRPGAHKPPASDRLALYGLYKQSMEGDVGRIASRPSSTTQPNASAEALRKEQEKWDAWKENEGLTRTNAKRRYIEKLIDTMQKYASQTDEARQLVEELEFVWDQIKSNSQPSGSEHSSPLQNLERSAYIHSDDHNSNLANSAAALGGIVSSQADMRVLSPVSEPEQDDLVEEDREEFVDAPISQVDDGDYNTGSDAILGGEDSQVGDYRRNLGSRRGQSSPSMSWRRRVEASLMKLTTEVAALREQRAKRFVKQRQQSSFFGWVLRLSWWAVQLIVADAVLVWVALWWLRRRRDRRLEGAIRVLLGDAVAEVRKAAGDVRMPQLPRMTIRRGKRDG